MECWLGGQLSAFGFAWLALGLWCARRGRPFPAGLAFGMLLYKPTFLVLIVPLLVIARRGWELLGVAATGLAIAAVSWLIVGPEACRDFIRLLGGYSHDAIGPAALFPTWKFVDLVSFFRLLFGETSSIGQIAALGVLALALPPLLGAWWRFDRLENDRRALLIAGTMTATMVLNLHMAVYDTTMVVPGTLLAAETLRKRTGVIGGAYKGLLVLLWVVPWFSQTMAKGIGFQPLTPILAALAAVQVALAIRTEEER